MYSSLQPREVRQVNTRDLKEQCGYRLYVILPKKKGNVLHTQAKNISVLISFKIRDASGWKEFHERSLILFFFFFLSILLQEWQNRGGKCIIRVNLVKSLKTRAHCPSVQLSTCKIPGVYTDTLFLQFAANGG